MLKKMATLVGRLSFNTERLTVLIFCLTTLTLVVIGFAVHGDYAAAAACVLGVLLWLLICLFG